MTLLTGQMNDVLFGIVDERLAWGGDKPMIDGWLRFEKRGYSVTRYCEIARLGLQLHLRGGKGTEPPGPATTTSFATADEVTAAFAAQLRDLGSQGYHRVDDLDGETEWFQTGHAPTDLSYERPATGRQVSPLNVPGLLATEELWGVGLGVFHLGAAAAVADDHGWRGVTQPLGIRPANPEDASEGALEVSQDGPWTVGSYDGDFEVRNHADHTLVRLSPDLAAPRWQPGLPYRDRRPDPVADLAQACLRDRVIRASCDAGIGAADVDRVIAEHRGAELAIDAPDDQRALALSIIERLDPAVDEVDVPHFGRAYRRTLPACAILRHAEEGGGSLTLPEHEVWLVALVEGAKIPPEEAFDRRLWAHGPEPAIRPAIRHPGVGEVEAIRVGIGIVHLGPAYGWSREALTQWKRSVDVHFKGVDRADPDGWDEEWPESRFVDRRYKNALAMATSTTVVLEPCDELYLGDLAYHRVSDGFRIGGVDGTSELFEPTEASDAVVHVARSVGLDRLIRATQGEEIGLADVELADTLDYFDTKAAAERSARRAIDAADPRFVPLATAIQSAPPSTSELEVPCYGHAYRRRLPAMLCGGVRLAARDVWLVPLSDAAQIPTQRDFERARWSAPTDQSQRARRRAATPSPNDFADHRAPTDQPWILPTLAGLILGGLFVAGVIWFTGRGFNEPLDPDELTEMIEALESEEVGEAHSGRFDLSDAPTAGPDDAPVTVVEVGAVGGAMAKRFDSILSAVAQQHPDMVRLAFVHYVPQGLVNGIDTVRATAAICLQDQGLFWEFRRLVRTTEGLHDIASINASLSRIADGDFDVDRWDSCIRSAHVAARIARETRRNRSRALSVFTTAIFVNGRRVRDPAKLADAVADAIAEASAVAPPDP